MSFGNFFCAKTSVALFISLENFRKHCEGSHYEARVIDVKITWVSNYRYPITKSSNRTPVIGHPRDCAPIT